ncbi:MAG: Uma2 family endonuclease [Hamadaea sp.]|nr:Uma2 family endonuclease [Hamadaea sp.]
MTEWTVDDLGDLPEGFRYELLNGRLITLNHTPFHQDVAGQIWNALESGCPDGWLVGSHQSISVDSRNELCPCVVVIGAEFFDTSPIPMSGVHFAVDIVQPTDSPRTTADNEKAYAMARIVRRWIINPLAEQVELTEVILNPTTSLYEAGETTTGVFTAEQPFPVSIDLPALSTRYAKLRTLVRHARS